MTDLLVKAFEQASKLSPQHQDAIAKWLLEELEADKAWDTSFAKSPGKLAALASEAKRETALGETKSLVPDEL